MPRLLAAVIGLLALATLLGAGESARTHGGRYLPGALVTVWCSEAAHPLVPQGEPGPGYEDVLPWLFSGDPECASADALNSGSEAMGGERSEWGVAGFMWAYEPVEDGGLAVVHTVDDVFGPDQGWMVLSVIGEDGKIAVGGCGAQTLPLPAWIRHDWDPEPVRVFWAFIDVATVTEDLTACFSSAGTITATIG